MMGGDGQIAGAVCAVSVTKQTTHWCGADMAVRRLIPLECERLQGFPPASQTCTVTLLPADAGTAPPVEVPVLMHLSVDAELKVLKRYLPGERCLTVAFADKDNNTLLPAFAGDLARLITTTLTQAEVLLEDNAGAERAMGLCTLHRCADHYSAVLPGTPHTAEPDDITQQAAGLKKTISAVARKQKLHPPMAEDLPGLFSLVATAAQSLLPAHLRNKPVWAFTLELRRGYTQIPWRGKCAIDCPDGPRYQALGNSMAVPVVRWLGERISQACMPHP